jgi:hypothetical protein
MDKNSSLHPSGCLGYESVAEQSDVGYAENITLLLQRFLQYQMHTQKWEWGGGGCQSGKLKKKQIL